MANKNISLLLNLHHPYIRHSEDSSQENEQEKDTSLVIN